MTISKFSWQMFFLYFVSNFISDKYPSPSAAALSSQSGIYLYLVLSKPFTDLGLPSYASPSMTFYVVSIIDEWNPNRTHGDRLDMNTYRSWYHLIQFDRLFHQPWPIPMHETCQILNLTEVIHSSPRCPLWLFGGKLSVLQNDRIWCIIGLRSPITAITLFSYLCYWHRSIQ